MSRGETELGELLKREFPHHHVFAQYPIKVESNRGRATLYLDYCIPTLLLAFEADGRQHEEYIPFFHKDSRTFLRGRNNDKRKTQWLQDHGYTLIRFSHREKIDQESLRRKIAQS
jgi:very-short-patch-repair endonuclease